MMIWELGIPGKQGVGRHQASWGQGVCETELISQTNWEGGMYKVLATFPEGRSETTISIHS